MERLKGIFKDFINGNSKSRLIVTSLVSIILVSLLMLGSTYSLFSTSNVDEDLNVYKTGNLDITYTLSSDNIKLTDSVPTSIENSLYIEPYRITISNSGNVPYMFNVILDDSTATDIISYEYIMTQVGKLDAKKLSECDNNVIKEDIIVPAGESVDVDVRIFLAEDIKNTELGKSFYAKLAIDGLAVYNDEEKIDNSILIADVIYSNNKPNLDSGLIPVYYDDKDEVWKKADSGNSNNSWYDYNNKRWANAVLVRDISKRNSYLSAKVGSIIEENDIVGYFVWIPRFKYRVWNVNRQALDEDDYAYMAYTNGIDIKWEKGIKNTSNIKCNYDVEMVSDDSNLSDVCVYNNTNINVDSSNKDYKDVWYTHLAFTSNDSDKEGFWIGKFETTVKDDISYVLPNMYSYVDFTNKSIEEQYAVSTSFYDYGLTVLNSRSINNLEWGAVSYLTHSIYGMCDKDGCDKVIDNNSYYTGVSSDKYNYQGYKFDVKTGKVIGDKDINKIASTTGNITGVYDMNGGASELVLGEMIDLSKEIDNNNLYYSYGTGLGDKNFCNRTRLGDATCEFLNVIENNSFVSSDDSVYSYLVRNNIFGFRKYNGVWTKEDGAITVRTILK